MQRHDLIRQGERLDANRPRRLCVGILCLTAVAGMGQAGEIYKSVDANGHVVYSDHVDSSMSKPNIVQLEDPRFPPHELHFCSTNCFTLILDNGVYRRTDGTDESWTVDTFSTTAIVLHRHDAPADWNGFSQDVAYAGQISNDRLVGVTVNGKAMSGVDASWGTALNTLPGNNAERDAKNNSDATPNAASTDTVSVASEPPPLPEEDQPVLSQDGSLWAPGYWYWRGRYVWIPGGWVRPPQMGFLWTPAYWSSAGTVFVFHPGHWGSTVGFYGGVNYGYGYFGNGYTGGHWIGNSFAYNSAVNHVNPAVAHHMYTESALEQGSRGVRGYSGGPRSSVPIHTVSQRQTLLRPDSKPVTSTVVQRSVETPPTLREVHHTVTAVRTSRGTSTRAGPTKR